MKKNLLFLLILFSSIAYGQAPNQINYQGIARNSVGNVLPNKNIAVRLSVHDVSATGYVVYSEIRKVTTSNFGLFNIAIGGPGAASASGTITGINWSSGAKFLQVEVDPSGGANFIDLGAAQLLSVPYALFSGNSTNASPAGPAGGDLSGIYPNPTIANGAITTIKVADGSITMAKLGPDVIFSGGNPGGPAGGDLSGTYPNPTITANAITTTKLADNSVTTAKIADASVTSAKLAAGVIPTSLPPNGTAGGDLSGTFPNPTVATGAITTIKLADNSITTAKIVDASVTSAKLAAGVIPTSLPPNGTAGGDLSGAYPNPTITTNAVTTTKLADNSVTTAKIVDASVTSAKLAAGVIPTSLPPNGTAGGDLSGTFPNPTVATGAITTIKLADNSITTAKLVDASVTSAKLAAGVIPTSLPPNGTAGGDLSGTFPNPLVNKIQGISVNNTVPASGQVLKFNGTQWAPGTDISGSGSPTGPAGGDLSGSYPDPNIASGAITTPKIANGAVNTPKIVDAAVTTNKLADNAVTTIKIADASVTSAKLAAGVIPTSLPPNGTAGGDLTGTYPNPTITTNAITTTKLADNSITTAKIIDASVTSAKLAAGVIPTSLPPNGTAGGDLSGTYPNPGVNKIQGVTVNTTGATTGQVLKFNGTQWAPGSDNGGSGGTPTGPAGGDLSGTYPDPTIATNSVTTTKLADNSITTAKIVDASVTSAKLAAGIIPTSLPPNGTAGGDLTGTYPNPTITANAITTSKLADNSITTAKIVDASVTSVKLAAGIIPTSLPPNGTAGGDLTGTYPNPTITANAITTTKLADNSITTAKIIDASVTSAKLAAGVIPTSLPPNGTAGGDLSGTYPNPGVNKIQGITVSTTGATTGQVLKFDGTQWAPGSDNGGSGGTPTGPAGGDLSGTYPDPTIATNAVTTTKLADNSVTTTKIVDASVTSAKLAAGVIPTSLPPNGTAGGDLSGTYPNPLLNKIQGTPVINTVPISGQVLKFNGTQWAPGTDNTGSGLTLPYSNTLSSSSNLISVSNSGTGAGLEGINTSANANAFGVIGQITSASAGTSSAAIRGISSGFGMGVYGTAVSGHGVLGTSTGGVGVFGTSNTYVGGYFDISNALNNNDALTANTVGSGNGVSAVSEQNNGVWGTTSSPSAAGILGFNVGGGEAVVGQNASNTSASVVGKNSGTYAGVQGIAGADGGIGIHALANQNGLVNDTAFIAEIQGNGAGTLAVFKANNLRVARIDKTGRGFFNGGTQLGGADVAEYFDVEGNRKEYEPGDVLIISQNSDRKVEKSSSPYSTLVAGVYATKPGVLLTEENAEQDQLDQMVPMGVVGVIPAKVCIEGGAIKRGDLIVTSSHPGVAMKADPDKVKVGQVIGKALQDYNGESIGKINVLVSIK
jgi:Repeat of unknown function (DUF5907)